MKSHMLKSSVVLALACSMVACAKEDADDGGSVDGIDPVPAGEECDPNGEIPCYENYAEPCENYDTQFLGDEYCRKAPDLSVGFQLHVGPTDYTDPDQTDKYMILPGEETNWSEISPVSPYPETVYTRGYHSYMRPGSHHMIMFGLRDRPANADQGPVQAGAGVESAVGATSGVFLGGATRAIQNIDTKGALPEDQGIGSEVAPGRSVAVNLHFINLEQEPLLQEIWVNFILIPEAEVTKYVKPITWYGGILMNIAPGTHTTLASAPGSCTAPADMRVGMMTAHAHANTLRVGAYRDVAGARQTLFEDFDWHEPTPWRFNNSDTNPVQDVAAKQSGSVSGIVTAAPGDTFGWECEVENKQNVNLTFGNRLLTGEMCNIFGFYFTENKAASPWMCAFM